MQEYLKHFGIQLYRLRKRASMTQKQLADRLKVSQPYIVALESGRGDREPSLSLLLEIVNIFNVGVDNLLGINYQGSADPLSSLEENDRELIEQLADRLAQSNRMDRFISHSDSIRALGGRAVRDSEMLTGVELAPQIMNGKVGVHTLQEERF